MTFNEHYDFVIVGAGSGVNGDRVDLQMQMRPFSMLGASGMYRAGKAPAITA